MKRKYNKELRNKVEKDMIVCKLSELFGLCIKHKSCKYNNIPKLKKAIDIVKNTGLGLE